MKKSQDSISIEMELIGGNTPVLWNKHKRQAPFNNLPDTRLIPGTQDLTSTMVSQAARRERILELNVIVSCYLEQVSKSYLMLSCI